MGEAPPLLGSGMYQPSGGTHKLCQTQPASTSTVLIPGLHPIILTAYPPEPHLRNKRQAQHLISAALVDMLSISATRPSSRTGKITRQTTVHSAGGDQSGVALRHPSCQ